MATSSHLGMGARKYSDGISFRVWAPNAASVAVAGDFNGWSLHAHALTTEGNGYWSTDVPGAQLGQRYKYVIVNGHTFWKNDPYAREMTHSAGESVIHDADFDWQADSFRLPPWNELVIYELHIGTFNPDPFANTGKFQGVIEKLPYLRDLGINALEIMASGEFPTDTSWGYNPAYIFAIESGYGGTHEFKRLVKSAHEHGIAVIFDVVYNHLGPNDLDMWQFDGWERNGKGGIYFYNDWRSTTPWGDTRPDYGRGEVRQYIKDNALMWLERRHVDGLRFDATRFIHNVYGSTDFAYNIDEGWGLLQWINSEIRERQPWKITIAEDMQNNASVTRAVSDGGAGFGSQLDAEFVHKVRRAIIAPSDADRDMFEVRDAVTHRYNNDAFGRVIYTESHDEIANGRSRVPEEVWPGNAGSWESKKRSTLGAALILTSPGIPMLFQGQEFLEDQYFRDTDPLDWRKTEWFSGILKMYRDLIRLRRNWFKNTRGLGGHNVEVHHTNNNGKVIAFQRWDNGGPGDDVIIVLNMANRSYSDYRIGFPRSGLWRVRFNSDWSGYSLDFGNHPTFDALASLDSADGMPSSGTVGIGPYTAIILSQD